VEGDGEEDAEENEKHEESARINEAFVDELNVLAEEVEDLGEVEDLKEHERHREQMHHRHCFEDAEAGGAQHFLDCFPIISNESTSERVKDAEYEVDGLE
jgi:hypothetical protein